MIEEHEPARDRVLALAEAQDIFPEGSAVATRPREESEQIIADLLAQSGGELESSHVQFQVTAHTQALELIDAMIPAADADELEAELTQLRASVAGHLDAAQQLLEAVDNGD